MSTKDSLGDRMKAYESVAQTKLMGRTPVVIRIDGKAFHTFTRGLQKPFDSVLGEAMSQTMLYLCENIQGAVLGYTQSDEISILLQDWATFETDAWFDNKVQKMVSVAASLATAKFNQCYNHPRGENILALFDARVFNMPFEEVTNCLVWRQQDAVRNSIQSLSQAHFSHKELQGKNVNQLQDMLILQRGINWNDIPTRYKRGTCAVTVDGKMILDYDPPIFTQDRNYVERFLQRD